MGGKSPHSFHSPGPCRATSKFPHCLSRALFYFLWLRGQHTSRFHPPTHLFLGLYFIPFPMLRTWVSPSSQTAWRRHQIQCGPSGNGQSYLHGPELLAGNISANPHPT